MKDPKKIVTSYAFEVESSLLGKPIATPKRRFAAVLIDLCIASILTALGGIVLGFFVVAIRYRRGHIFKRWIRIGFASVGAGIVFVLCLVLVEKDDLPEGVDSNAVEVSANISDLDMKSVFLQAMDTTDSDDSVNTEQYINEFSENLEQEIMASLDIIQAEAPELPKNAPSLLMSYAEAYQKQDSAGMDTLQRVAQDIVAGQKLAELEHKNMRSEEIIDKMEEENEQLREIAENPGFLRTIKATANDLGLAVGWIGIYFVVFLAFWKGQTPGKRLLNLQVVRLNGEELNLWNSFKRFGGYAAGFATGLLGFLQVYWDANRQGIHDKIAGTVVLDKREKRVEQYQDLVSKHVQGDQS